MLASYTVTMENGTEAGIDHLSRRIFPSMQDEDRAHEIASRVFPHCAQPLKGVVSIVETFEAAGSSNRKELYVSPAEKARREEHARKEAIRFEHRWATQHYLDAIENARDELAAATRKLDRILLQLQTNVELPDDKSIGRYERGSLPATIDPYRWAAEALSIVSRAPSYVHPDTLVNAAGNLERAAAATQPREV